MSRSNSEFAFVRTASGRNLLLIDIAAHAVVWYGFNDLKVKAVIVQENDADCLAFDDHEFEFNAGEVFEITLMTEHIESVIEPKASIHVN
jgi:hypothetical protein